MGFNEPRSRQLGKALQILSVLSLCAINSATASTWSGIEVESADIGHVFRSVPGWRPIHSPADLSSLVHKAERALSETIANTGRGESFFDSLWSDKTTKFTADRTVDARGAKTVKFAQRYKGLEVVGNEAMVHFANDGTIHDVQVKPLDASLDIASRLTTEEALRILTDRYQNKISLSEPAKLKVLRDFDGKTHLVYHMLTRSTATHDGQEVFLDAHNGSVVLEFERTYDADSKGKRTVYSADTEEARENVDGRGYPTGIDMSWYNKVIEDGQKSDDVDRSGINAYRNSGAVYDYYLSQFNRKSFDDQDSRLVSIVHMGVKMNNAFWSSEYKIMAYGDGDGEHLTDLTYGLDVAAHEITHGLTSSTAKLVYAAESGALNESYSDFFGKMVDYTEGDWDIAAKVMAPQWKRRALRNMKNPEEFKQPGSNDSPLRVRTDGNCTRANDRCGVHTNSGIPNRAAVLIVEAIGKEKTEQLYYRVLTTRLSATSTFKEAREATEQECIRMFGSANSNECSAVTKAFDTVKM